MMNFNNNKTENKPRKDDTFQLATYTAWLQTLSDCSPTRLWRRVQISRLLCRIVLVVQQIRQLSPNIDLPILTVNKIYDIDTHPPDSSPEYSSAASS
jgi:hypothetical protein